MFVLCVHMYTHLQANRQIIAFPFWHAVSCCRWWSGSIPWMELQSILRVWHMTCINVLLASLEPLLILTLWCCRIAGPCDCIDRHCCGWQCSCWCDTPTVLQLRDSHWWWLRTHTLGSHWNWSWRFWATFTPRRQENHNHHKVSLKCNGSVCSWCITAWWNPESRGCRTQGTALADLSLCSLLIVIAI